jgi:hypothetical protein
LPRRLFGEGVARRLLGDLARALLINPPSGMAGGYWLGYLKSNYPTEYAHLRDIREGCR